MSGLPAYADLDEEQPQGAAAVVVMGSSSSHGIAEEGSREDVEGSSRETTRAGGAVAAVEGADLMVGSSTSSRKVSVVSGLVGEAIRGFGACFRCTLHSATSLVQVMVTRVLSPFLRLDRTTGQAMGLVALSAFIYSLQSLNVKLLGSEFRFWTISFFRGLSGGLASLASAYYCADAEKRRSPSLLLLGKPKNRPNLVMRGVLGGITIITAFAAIQDMSLASASVLIFTSPLWTALLSTLLRLDAVWTRVDTVAACFSILGMVIMLRPSGQRTSAAGVVAALVSAISMAGVNLSIRLVKDEDTSVITLYAMVGCLVLAFPGMVYEQAAHVGEPAFSAESFEDDVYGLLLTGLLSWGAQMSKTYALQTSRSLGVLVMRYTDIVWAFMWDAAVMHTKPDGLAALGAIMIVGSCVGTILAKGGKG